jgi:hypothetical protein
MVSKKASVSRKKASTLNTLVSYIKRLRESKVYYYLMILFFIAINSKNIHDSSLEIKATLDKIKELSPKNSSDSFLKKIQFTFDSLRNQGELLRTLFLPIQLMAIMSIIFDIFDIKNKDTNKLEKQNTELTIGLTVNKIVKKILKKDQNIFSNIVVNVAVSGLVSSMKSDIQKLLLIEDVKKP